MRKLLFVFLLLLIANPVFGTSYYARSNGEITAVEWDTTPAGGGTDLVWGNLANGDVLYANAKTISIANNIGSGSVTATLTTAKGAGTAGGKFTFNVGAVAAKTLYVNITAGTTTCLEITGEGSAGTELTIYGDVTGGSSTSAYGIYDYHYGTDSAIIVTGNLTAGSNADTLAYNFACDDSVATVSINGNCTPTTDSAACVNNGSQGTMTVTGNCYGHASTPSVGCLGNYAGGVTVIGNIISGTGGIGASGKIIWNPTAPSNGVTGHYINFCGASPVFAGKNTDDASKALTTFYYIDPTDGTSDQGSSEGTGGSGGGAYAY